MSYVALIEGLLEDIDDPEIRLDVASTIHYLYLVYRSGKVSDEDILDSLEEICYRIHSAKDPTAPKEVIEERAVKCAEEIMERFRLSAMRNIVRSRFRLH